MPEVVADFNKEGTFKYRPPSVTTNAINLVPKVSQTALLVAPLNTDESASTPTNYTYGGLGSVGPVFALKGTTGVPADTDFSGATPVVPVPPIGTAFWNTTDFKISVRNAAATYKTSAAFT